MKLMSVGLLTTTISASAVPKQDHGAVRKRNHPHVRGGRPASWRQSDINLHAEAVPAAVREICFSLPEYDPCFQPRIPHRQFRVRHSKKSPIITGALSSNPEAPSSLSSK